MTPLRVLERKPKIIPPAKSDPPNIVAAVMEIKPLEIGRSGRSTLSTFTSKTSLRVTPPAYSKTDARTRKMRLENKRGSTGGEYKVVGTTPAMAIPASISAAAVGRFAGLASRK